MMKRFSGGTTVAGGYYLDLSGWSFEAVSGEQGTLPGGPTAAYVRMPFWALVPAVLLLSLCFIMFFPFIGFALFAYAVAMKVRSLGGAAVESASTALAPTLSPGEAYFSGRAEDEEAGKGPPAALPPALDELEKDIAVRREGEAAQKPSDE